MFRKQIVTLLLLLLIAPVNSVAAASMAVSVTVAHGAMAMEKAAGDSHAMHEMTVEMAAPDMLVAHNLDSHNHSPEDCDDYCMSCSNHCSSSAIVSSSKNSFELDREFAELTSAHTLSRAYLLFRPPIRA